MRHQFELQLVPWATDLIVELSDSPEAKKRRIASVHPLMCVIKGAWHMIEDEDEDDDEIDPTWSPVSFPSWSLGTRGAIGSALHTVDIASEAWQSPGSTGRLWLGSLPVPPPLLDPRFHGDDAKVRGDCRVASGSSQCPQLADANPGRGGAFTFDL